MTEKLRSAVFALDVAIRQAIDDGRSGLILRLVRQRRVLANELRLLVGVNRDPLPDPWARVTGGDG